MTAIKNVRVVSLAAITVAVFISFAPVVFADDLSGGDGGGGYDSGYSDISPSDSGYSDIAPYDSGYSDIAPYDSGYSDISPYDSGYSDITPQYDAYDVYGVQDVYGNETTQENGVGYSYNDYASSPSYASSYTPSFSFSAPASYYSAPVQQQRPVVQQQQQQQQQQAQPISIVNNNVNTNTNVNSAPAVTTVTPIYQSSIQYPVQYVYQQPVYQTPIYNNYQNVYCTISSSQTYAGYGQTVYLTWSAPGATSAYLSGIGSVNVNGSMPVSPVTSMTYTLTVQGYGGSNTCSTYVTVNGPSVSLSQIPYTGFDFGILGDSMYWLSLLAFAAAGAYLMIYYRGGMLALAGATMTRKAQAPAKKVEAVVTATAKKIEKVVEPVRASLADLPVFTGSRTSDTMSLVRSTGNDAPRIIISRA